MLWEAPDIVLAVGLGGATAFVGSVPVAGPLAVLVVERALSGQRLSATMTALGGGLVEGTYALGVALALPLLMQSRDVFVPLSRGLGSVIIVAIGLALVVRPSLLESHRRQSKRRSLVSGIAVTAVNPTLLASWTIVTSSLYVQGWLSPAPRSAVSFAIGVTAGTTGWFSLVALLGGRIERRLDASRRRAVMRFLGVVLVGAGICLAVQFLSSMPSSWRGSEVGEAPDPRVAAAGFPAPLRLASLLRCCAASLVVRARVKHVPQRNPAPTLQIDSEHRRALGSDGHVC